MQKKLSYVFDLTLVSIALIIAPKTSWSLDQIIRPYQSVRSSGMGGLTLTTGLYDENYFGNPARVMANPKTRFSLFDITAEVDSTAISHISDLTSNGDFYSKMSSTAGSNNHVRVQTAFPALYLSPKESKMHYAFGILMSTQADVELRNSLQIDPTFVTDIGPAFTIGRYFLENDALSIGLTAHATFRLASNRDFTFIDLIEGKTLSATSIAGQGAGIDFDLGSTYVLPIDLWGAKYTAAFAINNILGGSYTNLGIHPIQDIQSAPPAQPRSFGFGISAKYDTLWAFTDFVAALEFKDIGNNPDGGLFRTVHIGAEARYGVLIPRLGINQGYLCAGLGLDLRYFTLDFATYGEELTLNPGGMEDRRYAFKLAFQI